MRRRDAFVIGGLVALALAVPPVLRRIPSDFEFEPIAGADGFRRLRAGAISGGVDPFFGLGEERVTAPEPSLNLSCQALFGPEGWTSDVVPVAIFSDFNCPYCKVLERRLIDLRDDGAGIRLIWHEMPLLGPFSENYARAVLAARVLGAEDRVRRYLMQNPLRPGPSALRALAEATGVSPEALIRETKGDAVSEMLRASLALGRRLGIPGTPGTVVGRTLVIGAIDDADLRRLIKLEAAEQKPPCS